MINDHLTNTNSLPSDLHERTWVSFVERLRRTCEGRVAWPSRVSSQHFCQFIFALFDARYYSKKQEIVKAFYFGQQKESKKQRCPRKGYKQINPSEGHGPLVMSLSTFMEQAVAANFAWMLASSPEDDDEGPGCWGQLVPGANQKSFSDDGDSEQQENEEDDWKNEEFAQEEFSDAYTIVYKDNEDDEGGQEGEYEDQYQGEKKEEDEDGDVDMII